MFKYLLITLLLIGSGFCPPQQNNSIDQMVMSAASDQLQVYLSKINSGNRSAFGFGDEDDLSSCTVGKPYRMLNFKPEFYSGKLSEDVNYLDIKNEWRVPVMLDSSYRVLLTVNGNPGNFAVSGMGGSGLAKELGAHLTGTDANETFYLLRIYKLSADFFVTERDNSFAEAQFIPLSSAIKAIPALAKKRQKTYTLDEVQKMVRDALAPKPVKKTPHHHYHHYHHHTKKKANTK